LSESKSGRKGKPASTGKSKSGGVGGESSVGGSKGGGIDSGSIGGASRPMDLRFLEQIVKLMQSNGVTTLEWKEGERRILLRRGEEGSSPAPAPAHHAPAVSPATATPAASAPTALVNEDANLIPIKSIMVGTFYAAASPDAKPFVSVGSSVNEETDVCVIEAMKVFNTIKAECKGTIKKIMVENGQAVEFGQTLFLVKP